MTPELLTTILFTVGGLAAISTIGIMLRFYNKCGPNQAMIITGAVPGGIQVIRTGGSMVWPLINQKHIISLEVLNLTITNTDHALIDCYGVPLYIKAVAHVKVKDDEYAIAKAAERFLGKPPDEIEKIASEIVLGNLCATVSTLSLTEAAIHKDDLTSQAKLRSTIDLENMGLSIEFLAIKELRQKHGD